jgi:hypothetical protein
MNFERPGGDQAIQFFDGRGVRQAIIAVGRQTGSRFRRRLDAVR